MYNSCFRALYSYSEPMFHSRGHSDEINERNTRVANRIQEVKRNKHTNNNKDIKSNSSVKIILKAHGTPLLLPLHARFLALSKARPPCHDDKQCDCCPKNPFFFAHQTTTCIREPFFVTPMRLLCDNCLSAGQI